MLVLVPAVSFPKSSFLLMRIGNQWETQTIESLPLIEHQEETPSFTLAQLKLLQLSREQRYRFNISPTLSFPLSFILYPCHHTLTCNSNQNMPFKKLSKLNISKPPPSHVPTLFVTSFNFVLLVEMHINFVLHSWRS